MITCRKATAEDIYSALDIALRVFIEFEAPDYEPDAVGKFKSDCIDNEDYINKMMAAGEFLSERFYPYFEEMVGKWGVKL